MRDAKDLEQELGGRAAHALEVAKKAGAQHAAVMVRREHNIELEVRSGALEQVKDSTARTLTVRLFVDGRYGSHDTTDLRDASLATFVTDAVALTRALEPDADRKLPEPALYQGAPRLALVDPAVLAISREQRLGWALDMSRRVVGKPKVISTSSGVDQQHVVVAQAASNGLAASYQTTTVDAWTDVTLDDGPRRPESGAAAVTTTLTALPSPASIADDAFARATARLGSIKAPTRRSSMIVVNRVAGALLGHLVRPATAAAVQQGRSQWKGKIGQRVLSPRLTIVDDPTLSDGLASRPFDDEGIAARRLPIIEAGALANLYVDTYYGAKLGIAPTTGQRSNRVVTPGTRDLDALLASVGDGVLVTGWLGGNVDATTGAFSLGVRGHLVEKGRIATAIGETNVSGNIQELFAHLVEVGSDPWMYSADRAPSLVFEGVQFAGA